LRLHEAGLYDLVLLDCELPVRDGFATAAEIRAREASIGRHTPIIALTASTSGDDSTRCREAGMDGVLSKPLRTEDLLAVLRRWRPQLAAPRP
ncbi:MAG: response regulator, partial [Bryobacteraceae bacterium]